MLVLTVLVEQMLYRSCIGLVQDKRETRMDDLPWLASLTIQEVARRTGTTVSTLRAWERRYGIPRPSRTASGHRLYAQPMIEQINLLKHYCSTGIRPQQA